METLEVEELIQQGENQKIEFKSAKVVPGLAREIVAFANTFGGTIFIGIEDDGTVSGLPSNRKFEEWVSNISRNNIIPSTNPKIEIIEVGRKKVCAIQVDKGKDKPYQTIDGKFWIRVGSTNRTATKEELSHLFQQSGLVHYDISPISGTSINNLNPAKLQQYWQTYYQFDYEDLDPMEKANLLYNADILVDHEQDKVVSVGGMLLFGNVPQKYLPHSSIVFAVFAGKDIADNIIDKKEINGTLPDLIDQTTRLIKLFNPTHPIIEGNKREEQQVFPSEVIREAMVNAVAHRDYSITNRKTTVYLYEDRLEITSPGSIANTLSIEKIKFGNSAPRNLFLVKYLDNMRYIDGLGRGIPRMIRLMQDRIDFAEIGILFRVTLWKESR